MMYKMLMLLMSIVVCSTPGLAKELLGNMPLPFSYGTSNTEFSEREALTIYLILKHTNEGYIHSMRGQDNTVYLSSDGHNEAVFDNNGELLEDGMNEASYNFAHPVKEPLMHFLNDINPWIVWGASERDPTSIQERTYAYMGDLEGGFRRAFAQKNDMDAFRPIDFDETQKSVLKFWAVIIDKGAAEAMFALFDANGLPSDADLIGLMQALNNGFNAVYVTN